MQKLFIAIALVICMICFAAGQDVESIKRQIIDQYNKYGGSSIVHPDEIADVIDPAHFSVHL